MDLSAFSLKPNLRDLVNSPGSRFGALDGLRVLCITLVYWIHTFLMAGDVANGDQFLAALSRPALRLLITHGQYAVDVFFIISGFLVGGQLFSEKQKTQTIDVPRFHARRSMRLAPVYFTLMALIIIGKVVTNTVDERVHYAWANFLYINNYLSIDHMFLGYSWYVAFEEQFYFCCAMIFMLVPRRWLLHVLISLLVFGVLVRYAVLSTANPPAEFVMTPVIDQVKFARWYDTLLDKTHMRYGSPLCGVLLAYVFRYTKTVSFLTERPRLSSALFVAALAPIAYVFGRIDYVNYHEMSSVPFLTFERHVMAICLSVLVLLLLLPNGLGSWFGRLLSARWCYPVGQLSYSVYLIHQLVLFAGLGGWYQTHSHDYVVSDLLMLGMGLLIPTLLIALGFYLVIEKPVLRLRGGEGSHAKATAATVKGGSIAS